MWETNEYFSKDIIAQLKNPASSLANYQVGVVTRNIGFAEYVCEINRLFQASLITEYAASVQPIMANIQTQYASLQQQHNDFVAHATAQLASNVCRAGIAIGIPFFSSRSLEVCLSFVFLIEAISTESTASSYASPTQSSRHGSRLSRFALSPPSR